MSDIYIRDDASAQYLRDTGRTPQQAYQQSTPDLETQLREALTAGNMEAADAISSQMDAAASAARPANPSLGRNLQSSPRSHWSTPVGSFRPQTPEESVLARRAAAFSAAGDQRARREAIQELAAIRRARELRGALGQGAAPATGAVYGALFGADKALGRLGTYFGATGDAAAGALSGQDFGETFGDSLRLRTRYSDAVQRQAPNASLVGQGAAGIGVGAALPAAGVTGVPQALAAGLGTGSVAGALEGGASSGTAQGALEGGVSGGLVGGAVGAAAGPVISVLAGLGRGVANRYSQNAEVISFIDRTYRANLEQANGNANEAIRITVDQLRRGASQFSNDVGAQPALIDLLNDAQVAEAAQIIGQSPRAQSVAREQIRGRTGDQQRQFAEAVQPGSTAPAATGGVVGGSRAASDAATNTASRFMNRTVNISGDATLANLLDDPDVLRTINAQEFSARALERVRDAVDNQSDIAIRDLDSIRQAVVGRAREGGRFDLNNLSEQIVDYIDNATSGQYRPFLRQVSAGRITGPVADTMLESGRGIERAGRDLSENFVQNSELRATLGVPGAERLQRVGQSAERAATNARVLGGSARLDAESGEAGGAITRAVGAAALASGRGSPITSAATIRSFLEPLRLSERQRENFARRIASASDFNEFLQIALDYGASRQAAQNFARQIVPGLAAQTGVAGGDASQAPTREEELEIALRDSLAAGDLEAADAVSAQLDYLRGRE